MSSPNYVTKRKYSVTLDFDVYEDFNPYEINWKKLFQIEGQEHLDVNIKNLDVESDINWFMYPLYTIMGKIYQIC